MSGIKPHPEAVTFEALSRCQQEIRGLVEGALSYVLEVDPSTLVQVEQQIKASGTLGDLNATPVYAAAGHALMLSMDIDELVAHCREAQAEPDDAAANSGEPPTLSRPEPPFPLSDCEELAMYTVQLHEQYKTILADAMQPLATNQEDFELYQNVLESFTALHRALNILVDEGQTM